MVFLFLAVLMTLSLGYAVSLEDLVQDTLENSLLIKGKRLDVEIQKAQTRYLKSSRFGELKGSLRGTRFEDSRILYPLTPPINPTNLVGARNQFIASLSYTLPLFTGFELERNVEISKLLEEIRSIDYELTKNEVVFNLKSAYLKALELRRSLEALKAYEVSLEKLLSDVELAVQLGRKAEVDLLKVRYEVERIRGEIEKVKSSLEALAETIAYLTGREDIDPREFEEVKLSKHLDLEGLEQKLLNLGVLKKASLQENVARKRLDIAKGRFLPRIYLSASIQRNMGNGEYKDLWQVGIALELSIFDFGKRKSQHLRSKLELERSRLFKKNLYRKLKRDIAEALSRVKAYSAEIETAKRRLRYATKVEEVERLKYEEGVSDMFHLLYAKAQRIQAQTEYYRALYGRERAVAYLMYLLEELKDE